MSWAEAFCDKSRPKNVAVENVKTTHKQVVGMVSGTLILIGVNWFGHIEAKIVGGELVRPYRRQNNQIVEGWKNLLKLGFLSFIRQSQVDPKSVSMNLNGILDAPGCP